jgi:probable F420-dependent oxidoreductase
MRIGLSAYDIAAGELMELARAADEAGFESVWLGEHLVLPVGYASEHPTTGDSAHQHHTGPIVDPSTVLVDPLVAFGATAAVTTDVTLATGIYLLPLRHPVAVARMTMTLQDVARGRFVLGIGSGWLREEFDTVGIPFDERGGRFDEAIDVLRALWSGEVVTHRGTHFSFGPVQLAPQPVTVPLVIGGNTDRALRRVAIKADGWFSSGTPNFEDALVLRDRVVAACTAAGRTQALPMHFRAPTPTPEAMARYADEGFDHVVVWADQLWPAKGDLDHKRGSFFEAARRLRGVST